jgi:hypothetical protein
MVIVQPFDKPPMAAIEQGRSGTAKRRRPLRHRRGIIRVNFPRAVRRNAAARHQDRQAKGWRTQGCPSANIRRHGKDALDKLVKGGEAGAMVTAGLLVRAGRSDAYPCDADDELLKRKRVSELLEVQLSQASVRAAASRRPGAPRTGANLPTGGSLRFDSKPGFPRSPSGAWPMPVTRYWARQHWHARTGRWPPGIGLKPAGAAMSALLGALAIVTLAPQGAARPGRARRGGAPL